MSANEKLELLKLDLQLLTDAFDTLLQADLDTAAANIALEGIQLTDSVADSRLQVMYAAWLYRCRAQTAETYQVAEPKGSGMPRMLRYALNNRLFAEKAGV